MKRAVISSLVLGCLAVAGNCQQVERLVAKLAAAKVLDDQWVGIDGHKSDTWKIYERLRDLASSAELTGLLAHRSPIVRGYAARALADTEAACDWKALLTRHLDDVVEFETQSGCCLVTEKYGDYLFDLARRRELLGDADWLDLGEMLVRKKSRLYAREHALRTLRFRDGLLHEIRTLAKNGDGPAAIALARYGLAADVPILLEHLRRPDPFDDNCQFLAAAISRDPRLLPELIALQGAAARRMARDNPYRMQCWLQAIAVHQNKEAADGMLRFLRLPLPNEYKQKNRRETLAKVLEPYPAVDAYLELRAELAR